MGKKIIFIRSNPVSPDPRVEKEIEVLAESGYEIKLIVWNREKNSRISLIERNLKSFRIKIFNINIKSGFGLGFKKNLIPLIKFQYNVLKVLIGNKTEYDIIHACDFDTVIPAYLCSKLFKKKYVYDIFDYYVDAFNVPNCMKKIIRNLDNYMISKADATIICTEKRKEQIVGANPKKLVVIHNTPKKVDFLVKKDYITSKRMKIVYVGILGEGRFIKELIEVIRKNNNYELHIGGFGKFENYIKKMGENSENIFYYGKIPYEETLELENSCDIITAIYDPRVKNHYFAAPNKFYEAMMLGKPTIMVHNTGLDYIISQNNLGEVINYNIEDLEKALKKLFLERNLWEKKSIKMKQIYNEKFSWDIMGKRLINLYSSFEVKI